MSKLKIINYHTDMNLVNQLISTNKWRYKTKNKQRSTPDLNTCFFQDAKSLKYKNRYDSKITIIIIFLASELLHHQVAKVLNQ